MVVSGRDESRGSNVVRRLVAAGGVAHFVAADLADLDDVRTLAERAEHLVGGLDILVNNAGVYEFGPTSEVTEESFDRMFAINTKATFFLTAAVAPRMVARGGGRIVNITTPVAYQGRLGAAAYGASKAAVAQLTRSWALEFGPGGVNVNAVSPGTVLTPGASRGSVDVDALGASTPAGRASTPEEIAAAVVFLAGNEASYIHGITLAVDGGRTA